MNKVLVKTKSKNYEVLISNDILKDSGKLIKKVINPCKALVVCDKNVSKLYLETVKKSLETERFLPFEFIFSPGEQSKTTKTALEIVDLLSQNDFSRSDIVVALGGGISGDMAAFAASIYLRGLRFVGVPTSLLAMVDSSVGGKTGVNLEKGKNLCGTFHQPELVLCDVSTLETLPKENFADGFVEAVKTAVLFDNEMFCDIEQNKLSTTEIITKSVEHKARIVEQDETEQGERKKLNLGHTIGHAIEKLSGYEISHGRAVAIGMVAVARFAERNGVATEAVAQRIETVLKKAGVSVKCEFSAKQLAGVTVSDKKRSANKISFIVPKRIGECDIIDYDMSFVQTIIETGIT